MFNSTFFIVYTSLYILYVCTGCLITNFVKKIGFDRKNGCFKDMFHNQIVRFEQFLINFFYFFQNMNSGNGICIFLYYYFLQKKKIFLFCKQIMRCDLLNCLCNIPTNTKSIYLFYWGNVKDSVEKTSYICTYTADDLAFKLRFALNCRVSKNTIRLRMYLVHLYNSALYVHRVT